MPRLTEPHPLEDAALAVFAKRPTLDRTSLAMGLCNPDPFTATFLEPSSAAPKLGISPNRAYLMVAEDVLGVMHGQGKLVRNPWGWYRLKSDSAPKSPHPQAELHAHANT